MSVDDQIDDTNVEGVENSPGKNQPICTPRQAIYFSCPHMAFTLPFYIDIRINDKKKDKANLGGTNKLICDFKIIAHCSKLT